MEEIIRVAHTAGAGEVLCAADLERAKEAIRKGNQVVIVEAGSTGVSTHTAMLREDSTMGHVELIPDEVEPCQSGGDYLGPDEMWVRSREGNKAWICPATIKRRKKMAKASKKRNRK